MPVEGVVEAMLESVGDLRLTDTALLEFGYRWLDIDYDTGERNEEFRYDVLTQGPVVGFGFRF